jgi:2,4-dienoyl-CoA reductase-like NADH-dependent reductase (Old Yellow Enzyme family)
MQLIMRSVHLLDLLSVKQLRYHNKDRAYPGTPGIHSKEQVQGWKLVTDAVHKNGGHIFLQLWHVGRISHSSHQPNNGLPVAPSAIAAKDSGTLPLIGNQLLF